MARKSGPGRRTVVVGFNTGLCVYRSNGGLPACLPAYTAARVCPVARRAPTRSPRGLSLSRYLSVVLSCVCAPASGGGVDGSLAVDRPCDFVGMDDRLRMTPWKLHPLVEFQFGALRASLRRWASLITRSARRMWRPHERARERPLSCAVKVNSFGCQTIRLRQAPKRALRATRALWNRLETLLFCDFSLSLPHYFCATLATERLAF